MMQSCLINIYYYRNKINKRLEPYLHRNAQIQLVLEIRNILVFFIGLMNDFGTACSPAYEPPANREKVHTATTNK